jgi:hypothetical protein
MLMIPKSVTSVAVYSLAALMDMGGPAPKRE